MRIGTCCGGVPALARSAIAWVRRRTALSIIATTGQCEVETFWPFASVGFVPSAGIPCGQHWPFGSLTISIASTQRFWFAAVRV